MTNTTGEQHDSGSYSSLLSALEDDLGARLMAAQQQGGAWPKVHAKFECRGVLGRGGFGLVLDSKDVETGRRVALKLRPVPDPEQVRLDELRREAYALAAIRHPAVVPVHEAGWTVFRTASGASLSCAYVAMEYVDGKNLTRWLREDRPSRAQRLAVLLTAGQAIVAAHAVKIVHRDVKPDNILIDRSGRVLVADFGLARGFATALLPSDGAAPGFSRPNTARSPLDMATGYGPRVVGTPGFMAPEATAGGDASPFSDQWSFAATCCEVLTGRAPVDTGTNWRLPAWHRLPRALVSALERALRRDPLDRFHHLQELVAVLEQAALGFPMLRRRRRRRVLGLALIGVAVLLQPLWAEVAVSVIRAIALALAHFYMSLGVPLSVWPPGSLGAP